MGVIGKPAGRPGKARGSMPKSMKARTDKKSGPSSGARSRIGGFRISQDVPSGETVMAGKESASMKSVPSGFGSPKRK